MDTIKKEYANYRLMRIKEGKSPAGRRRYLDVRRYFEQIGQLDPINKL